MKPKVSIICMTYNQVKFIRQALDGFVMQKTNFPFEAIVYDDASTDGTTDIVREYAKKYPDIIKPVIQTENQWSRGVNISTTFIWPKLRGKYVAVCDGDDYWTDPNKLQKQVDFLDAHPDYSICFHPVTVFWEDKSQPETDWPKRKNELTLEDLMYNGGITNCTVMYRWKDPTKVWPKNIYPGDWYLHLLHAKHGKIHFIPQVMARYRRQPAGISFAGTHSWNALHLQWGIHEMNFFDNVEKHIAPNKQEYHQYVCRRTREIVDAYALNHEFDKVNTVIQMCPDFLQNLEKEFLVIRKKYQYLRNRMLGVVAGLVVIILILILGLL